MDKDDFISRLNAGKQEIVKIEDLKPNPRNPRVTLRPGMPLYEKLKKSILRFSYVDPIVWNRTTGMIVSGHQRLQVIRDIAEEKGETLSELSVITVEMSEEDQDAFMIAVNKISGIWDQEKLDELFRDMDEDMYEFTGFDNDDIEGLLNGDDDFDLDLNPVPKKEKEVDFDHYNTEIQTPQYIPQGFDVTLDDLCDSSHQKELESQIRSSDLPDDIKQFLIKASYRHLVFNYTNIAEYYAKASPEIQDLMERSGLVIVDYDDAIEYGFVQLTKALDEIRDESIRQKMEEDDE